MSPNEHSCPYAVALQDDEDSLIQQCPAFQQGSCPFKNAKNTTDVQQTLKQLPASHLEKHGIVVHLLEELHQIHPSQENYQLPGGCPVKLSQQDVSFRETLEQMSLSAIMAKLMRDKEAEEGYLSESKGMVTSGSDLSLVSLVDVDEGENSEKGRRVSLSESLKTGTARAHQAAEDVHFVKNFIQGKIDRDLYSQLVGSLYHVYRILENCLEQHAVAHFGGCHFPRELNRTEALREDVDFWCRTIPEISPATRDYIERLEYISANKPLLLLAHAYTRYLGDLSGGKVLARVARRALQLEKGGAGLEFYDFEYVKSPKLFKDQYRNALDALPLTAQQVQDIVVEANVAFCLNMRLFEELDVQANVPGACVRPLEEALEFATATRLVSTEQSEECPFLKQSKQNTFPAETSIAATTKAGRCPWPFVFAHNPVQGMKDWQTWLVVGLLSCWIWNLMQQSPVAV